jgi:hypothetical protein
MSPASTPVAVSTSIPEALAKPAVERKIISIGPESDALAKALMAQATQGEVRSPFEALGKLAQLGVGSWKADQFAKAEKERELAPGKSLSEALAGVGGDPGAEDYRQKLGRALMSIGGQYGKTDWVMKGAELLGPQGKKDLMSVSPGSVIYDPNSGKPIFSAPSADQNKPMNVAPGNRVIDPTTGKEIYAAPEASKAPEPFTLSEGQMRFGADNNPVAGVPEAKPKLPTEAQLYEYYAQQERAAGREPLSIDDWQTKHEKARAPVTNLGPTGIDYGDPEAGTAWARNPDGTVKTDDNGLPIQMAYKGGSAEAKAADAARAGDAAKAQAAASATIVVQEVDRVLSLIEASPLTTTGIIGDYLKGVPGTSAADASKLIDTLEANASFDRLQAMRDASKTGGALGSITPRELELLAASIGSLKLSQSKDQLVFNLKRVQSYYRDAAEGRKIGASLGQNGAPPAKGAAPVVNDPLGIR